MTENVQKRTKWKRRTHYLVEPRLQLRIVGLVVGSSILLGILFAVCTYWRFQAGTEQYIARYPELAPALQAESRRALSLLLVTGMVVAVAFSLPVTLGTIFFTHRFTGPVNKTVRFLRASATDPQHFFATPLSFRRGDYFPELAEAVNALRNSLTDADAPESKNRQTG